MTDNWNEQQDFIHTGSIRSDSSWPESAREDRDRIFSYLEDRFGIDKGIFDDYHLFKRNKHWWLLRRSDFIANASGLKIWILGLKSFQKVGEYIKPTTRMIQVFGRHATRSILEIDMEGIKKLSEGERISADMGVDNGYIMLSFKGAILGLGLLIDGKVMSQIPQRDLVFIAGQR